MGRSDDGRGPAPGADRHAVRLIGSVCLHGGRGKIRTVDIIASLASGRPPDDHRVLAGWPAFRRGSIIMVAVVIEMEPAPDDVHPPSLQVDYALTALDGRPVPAARFVAFEDGHADVLALNGFDVDAPMVGTSAATIGPLMTDIGRYWLQVSINGEARDEWRRTLVVDLPHGPS